jgi:hypothetical protein
VKAEEAAPSGGSKMAKKSIGYAEVGRWGRTPAVDGGTQPLAQAVSTPGRWALATIVTSTSRAGLAEAAVDRPGEAVRRQPEIGEVALHGV